MMVAVPVHLDTLPGAPSGEDLAAALAAHYRGRDLVRVMPPEPAGRLEPEALNGADLLELRVYANPARNHAVLVARLDNLGKGASGAAVQNALLMLGLSTSEAAQPREVAQASRMPARPRAPLFARRRFA